MMQNEPIPKLTPKQVQVLRIIIGFRNRNPDIGSPTYIELAGFLKTKTASNARQHVENLINRGKLIRIKSEWQRSYKPTEEAVAEFGADDRSTQKP